MCLSMLNLKKIQRGNIISVPVPLHTIEAKGYVLDELREMANRVPFDDRGNPEISINDISGVHVLDYLQKVGSKLASDFNGNSLESVLEQMDLFVGRKRTE